MVRLESAPLFIILSTTKSRNPTILSDLKVGLRYIIMLESQLANAAGKIEISTPCCRGFPQGCIPRFTFSAAPDYPDSLAVPQEKRGRSDTSFLTVFLVLAYHD